MRISHTSWETKPTTRPQSKTVHSRDVSHHKENTMSDSDIDRKEVKEMPEEVQADLNADPITGEPGSHPVETGIAGTGGAVIGAAIGAIGGPLGMLIGGAIGAIAGGLAGSAAGESIDPTKEDAYWREHFQEESYYQAGYDYDTDYQPAYAVGYAMKSKYEQDTLFEHIEAELQQKWEEVKGTSRLTWLEAKDAIRDGWNRVSN